MDRYKDYASGLDSPATRHVQITPDNDNDLTFKPRAIYCNEAGAIVIRDSAGTDLSYTMAAGDLLPFRGVRVLATGTTGTYYAWD